MVEQEEEGCVFGLAAHGVDTGWDFGRWSHTGFLVHPLEERLRVALFRPGAEVVGCAFTVDVTRYRRRARVETIRIGSQGFCVLEVDEIRPQITRCAVGSVETIGFSCCHRYKVLDAETKQLFVWGRVAAEADVILPVHNP